MARLMTTTSLMPVTVKVTATKSLRNYSDRCWKCPLRRRMTTQHLRLLLQNKDLWMQAHGEILRRWRNGAGRKQLDWKRCSGIWPSVLTNPSTRQAA